MPVSNPPPDRLAFSGEQQTASWVSLYQNDREGSGIKTAPLNETSEIIEAARAHPAEPSWPEPGWQCRPGAGSGSG